MAYVRLLSGLCSAIVWHKRIIHISFKYTKCFLTKKGKEMNKNIYWERFKSAVNLDKRNDGKELSTYLSCVLHLNM